jgi:hypothetical protein
LGHYNLLHLVHQGYLGSLWAARGISGEANDLPALVRRIELPGGLSEEQGAQIAEAAWDSLELNHPHLLNVAEVVFANGAFALAHDYVEAEVLQALLLMSTVKKTPISPQVIARILLDVVDALTAVDTGAVGLGASPFHGGVTPESILVGSDGNARLIDFMIGGAISAHTLLRLNAGRVGYCSPEQLRGEPISERTDVFALAVIGAELLAGRRFFLGAANVIEKKIVEGNLPQINGWLKPGHGIEAKLLDVLDRGIAADPKKRIASPRALVDEFCAQLPQPASRAEVGALVMTLASKQLEVRGRKLGSHTGPLLSQKVGDARAPRSNTRTAIAAIVAAQPKPPMAATMAQFVAPKVMPPMPSAVVAKADAQQARNTEAQGPDSAAGVDELLSGVSEAVKREDMQSGTHRKVMSTLIGVAPPPAPVIGKPPPVTVPTAVIMNDAPSTRPRDAAGIADLIGTAVPSTRDAVGSVIASAVSKLREEPSAGNGSSADLRLATLSEELRRYRRLTILFGSTSVLLLTLLCWLVIGGLGTSNLGTSNTEPLPMAPSPVAIHRTPSVAALPAAPAPSAAPSLSNSATSATASAGAVNAGAATTNSPSTTSAPKTTRAPQKKQTKKFVPDDI